MSWSRTLLRVIAWIILIGPNLPRSPLANPGRPAPVSITEPSLLDSILDLLPIRLLYPPAPPYVEPLSFTLTSPAAWLCSPSLSLHGHCPTPDRSRLSASKEYVVRSARELAERASAVVWLATPHALLRSKPATFLSRTSSRARQALSVMRLEALNPVFDMIVRPKTTGSARVNAPSTQTWSGTNPAPPRAGHGWKRGRSCTYSHRPSKSSAFPSIYVVGESIRNWMDMVLARLVAVLSFMVNNLEYAQHRAKSFGQRAYDHPDAVFASALDSLPLVLGQLYSVAFGFEGLASHVLPSPGTIVKCYQNWFAPHLALVMETITEALPTSEQASFVVGYLSSTWCFVLHYAQVIASGATYLARNVVKGYHLEIPACFDPFVRLVLAHPFIALLAFWYLSVALVCLSLFVWFIRTPGDRLLAYMRVDRSCIARELAHMLLAYLVLERSRRSRYDNSSGSRGDSPSSDNRRSESDERDDLSEAEVEEPVLPSRRNSKIPLSLARRQALPSRRVIEYHSSADISGEQTNAIIYESRRAPIPASTLSDGHRKEILVLVLSHIWTITRSTLCSVAQLSQVTINTEFHDLVYGNPRARLQAFSSTSAFFISLFVQFDARPKPVLLIEYSQPPKTSAPALYPLLLLGRGKEALSLVRPYLDNLARYDSFLVTGPCQLVARAFRSIMYGDPYLRLVTQASAAAFLESLFARFEVRMGQPKKPRLMIEYHQSIEVAHKVSDHIISDQMLRLSQDQRKEVVALVSDYIDARDAEDEYPLAVPANVFVRQAFHNAVLGDSSSRIGFRELVTALYAALIVQLEEYRPELDLTRLTRKAPPPVRPGAEVYRPRALDRDDLSSEHRRQRLAKQEKKLTEAAHRRELAFQAEPEPLSDTPTRRRRRPRAGRQVKERREREEQERLALLGSAIKEET
ncbi:hypothetical protein BDV93DRAFT_519104 [Ceratobasidium sp. AG-I]|nr:hypothetical protein BDV93DRAFT_519104 [Ceratobasidium sp. AG-I]